MSRLKESWTDEHGRWSRRSLVNKHYVYLWVDGVHFGVRLEDASQCMLVVMGATADGKKELVAIGDGYRESEASWKEVLLDLKARGLKIDPKLAIGDGALGFWKALPQVFGHTPGEMVINDGLQGHAWAFPRQPGVESQARCSLGPPDGPQTAIVPGSQHIQVQDLVLLNALNSRCAAFVSAIAKTLALSQKNSFNCVYSVLDASPDFASTASVMAGDQGARGDIDCFAEQESAPVEVVFGIGI